MKIIRNFQCFVMVNFLPTLYTVKAEFLSVQLFTKKTGLLSKLHSLIFSRARHVFNIISNQFKADMTFDLWIRCSDCSLLNTRRYSMSHHLILARYLLAFWKFPRVMAHSIVTWSLHASNERILPLRELLERILPLRELLERNPLVTMERIAHVIAN